jgi:hypothetical protein
MNLAIMEKLVMEGILVLLSVGTSAMLIAHLLEYAIEVPHRSESNALRDAFSKDVPWKETRAEIAPWYDEAA